MRPSLLALQYAFCMAVFTTVAHARNSASQVLGESLLAQQSQSTPPITAKTQSATVAPTFSTSPQANAGQSPPSDLALFETKVRPAVIWVTTFDPKGNLLRTETGFFISADGRFVTTAHAVEGAINAVAKTADGGIYNVSGVLTVSKSADLAVLKADVNPPKLLRFLDLNKTSELVGARVAVVGSALAGNEGSTRETTITVQAADRLEIAGTVSASSVGSPLVNENGEAVAIVTSAGEKIIGRPVAIVDSLLSRVTADAQARWPQLAETSPTPHATPKPRLMYAPAPSFPPGQSLPGQSGTGRFRLKFDAQGNVTNIQIVTSTGNPYFDQAAIKTLREWKSAPSQGWEATVPVTFRTR
jgi:TonB family protein